jgi:4-amino-4-deoxy-L-arabinose transferase-like glycosyltransferase
MKLKRLKLLLPILIFVLTFIPRLYRLNNPVADWHSWRQADTAAVARNFATSRFNLFYPQADSIMSNNGLGLNNPERLFINEFPFYNAIVAVLYQQFGINTAIARFVSVVFASLGAVFLYLLATRLFGQKIGLVAGLYYALNPYNVYYGRVIMPEPAFISLSITSLYLCLVWVKSQKWSHAIIFALILALAMLAKPYAIFMGIPMAYWVIVNKTKILKNKQLYLILLVSLIPLALWRRHHNLIPEGTFNSHWLYNETNIRFTGAFFRWLIFERLNRLIFATGGFVLLIIGLLKSYQDKTKALIFAWFISIVLYMTIFAMGNVTHDYYQLPIMPVGTILISFGFWSIINSTKKSLPKLLNILIASSLVLLSLAFGWYEVKGYFNINHPEIVIAGQAADRLTPQDAVVIAPYNRDVAFLYQTNRNGWPMGTELEDKISKGATHYVSVNLDDETNYLLDQDCPVLEQTSQYIILEINHCLTEDFESK